MAEQHPPVSAQLIDLLFEEAGVGLCLVAPDGTVVRANAEWLRSTGLTPKQVIGKDILDLFPETRDTARALHARARAGQRVEVPRHAQHIGGRETWWEGSIAPVPMEGGNGLLITAREVTQSAGPAGRQEPSAFPPRRDICSVPEAEGEKAAERDRLAQQRQLALDAAHMGWWHYDPTTRTATYDQRYTEIFGVSGHERPNEEILRLLHPDDLPRVWAAVEAALDPADPKPYSTEYRVNRPDGTVRWVEAHGLATFEGEGPARRPTSLVGTVADITDRKRTVEHLAAEKERLAVTLRSIGDAVIATDKAGRVTVFNGVAEELTGWKAEEAVGKPVHEVFNIINEDTRQPAVSPVERVLREGIVVGLANHTALVARDGIERPIADSGAPIRDANGNTSGVVLVFRDQTAERRAEEAQQRLAAIVESTDDAILSKDLHGTILTWNAAAEQLLGYGADEVVGQPVEVVIPPERRHEENEILSRISVGDRVVHFETQRVTKRGAVIDVSITVSPVRDHDGRIIGASKIIRDITEQKRASETRRQNEERLRALADSMPQLAWTAQADGYITWYNHRWYEYTGTTPEQMEGWGWQNVHDPVTLPDVLRRWRESIATGTAFDMEFPLRGADGKFRRFLTRVSPLKDHDGQVLQWFGTNTDVTELVEAQESLKESARRKDEFLGMLSHELRNPLAPIRNSVYILERADPTGDQAARARSVIQRQTEHLTRLVDDLLDVTRIARGRIELRKSRVDLREVVWRAADDFRLMLDDRGVAFRTVLPDAKVWAEADATRITQVVGNLLHNAAKFTRRGDEVLLALRADENEAEIAVRDTGTGIDPGLLPRVFEAFVQGERTLARTEGGLGLGLALVKGITELHGGTVRAESAGKDKGAEFIVHLPLALAAVVQAASPAAVGRANRGRRVLVVDDNADAAESLADIVKMMGHTVEVAYEGPSAIEKARANPPDIVLCDIGLPGMSGYEVAKALRGERSNGMQLIAVSGYAQPEDVKKSVEAGFDGHVAKPCDPAQIERLIE